MKIISDKHFENEILEEKVLVVAHLYYLDTVKEYIPCLENIPEFCDVLLTASSSEHRNILQKIVENHNNWKVVEYRINIC